MTFLFENAQTGSLIDLLEGNESEQKPPYAEGPAGRKIQRPLDIAMMPPLSWYALNRTQPGPYRLRLYTSNPSTAYGVTVKSSPLFWHGSQHGTYNKRRQYGVFEPAKSNTNTPSRQTISQQSSVQSTRERRRHAANEGHPACVIIRIHANRRRAEMTWRIGGGEDTNTH